MYPLVSVVMRTGRAVPLRANGHIRMALARELQSEGSQVAGRYGVWVVTAVVASACFGVGGATAAAASPINVLELSAVETSAVETTISQGAVTAAVDADGDHTRSTTVPEAPTTEVPVAGSSTPTYTPAIMVTGLVFLGVAILMVVRSGSTREVDETE